MFLTQPLHLKKERYRSAGRSAAARTDSAPRPVPRRGRHRRAAKRAGSCVAAADPRVDARGVERVRAAAELRDLARASRVQARQANRANGLFLLC